MGEVGGLAYRSRREFSGIRCSAGTDLWTASNLSQGSAKLRLLSKVSSLASTTHSVAAFASFLVFLVNGRYRTLLDRVLRMRLAPPSHQVSREVSFEYLNRQLVWHAFTEFLLFLLPLVGISRWRRWISRAWRKTKNLTRSGIEKQEDAANTGELSFLPERTCAICYKDQNPVLTSENEIMAVAGASGGIVGSAQTDITNPYENIPCGCVYCFVCIATRLEAEEGEGWICLRCGELVKECKPWSGDVLEESSTTSTKKTVSFPDRDESHATDRGPVEDQHMSGTSIMGDSSDSISGEVMKSNWSQEESDSGVDMHSGRDQT